jgi:hypothetical protein
MGYGLANIVRESSAYQPAPMLDAPRGTGAMLNNPTSGRQGEARAVEGYK